MVGYNAQLAVDSKSQLIVHADVVTDQADTYQAVPMVSAVEVQKSQICEGKTDEVKYVMDCGYFSGENLKSLEGRDLYVPDQEYVRLAGGKGKPEERTGEIGPPPVKEHENRDTEDKPEFTCDAEADAFICPQGGKLTFRRARPFQGVQFRDERKNACGDCPLRAQFIGGSKNPTRKDVWVKASDLPGLKAKTLRVFGASRDGPSGFELALAMREKLSPPRARRPTASASRFRKECSPWSRSSAQATGSCASGLAGYAKNGPSDASHTTWPRWPGLPCAASWNGRKGTSREQTASAHTS